MISWNDRWDPLGLILLIDWVRGWVIKIRVPSSSVSPVRISQPPIRISARHDSFSARPSQHASSSRAVVHDAVAHFDLRGRARGSSADGSRRVVLVLVLVGFLDQGADA